MALVIFPTLFIFFNPEICEDHMKLAKRWEMSWCFLSSTVGFRLPLNQHADQTRCELGGWKESMGCFMADL
jgi:hypothetical protein